MTDPAPTTTTERQLPRPVAPGRGAAGLSVIAALALHGAVLSALWRVGVGVAQSLSTARADEDARITIRLSRSRLPEAVIEEATLETGDVELPFALVDSADPVPIEVAPALVPAIDAAMVEPAPAPREPLAESLIESPLEAHTESPVDAPLAQALAPEAPTTAAPPPPAPRDSAAEIAEHVALEAAKAPPEDAQHGESAPPPARSDVVAVGAAAAPAATPTAANTTPAAHESAPAALTAAAPAIAPTQARGERDANADTRADELTRGGAGALGADGGRGNGSANDGGSGRGIAAGVTRTAQLVSNPRPVYPRLSIQLGEQGEVLCRIEIDAAGNVVRVTIARSSGYKRLDAAAIAAVERWRFEPAQRDGRASASMATLPVVFQLKDSRAR